MGRTRSSRYALQWLLPHLKPFSQLSCQCRQQQQQRQRCDGHCGGGQLCAQHHCCVLEVGTTPSRCRRWQQLRQQQQILQRLQPTRVVDSHAVAGALQPTGVNQQPCCRRRWHPSCRRRCYVLTSTAADLCRHATHTFRLSHAVVKVCVPPTPTPYGC